MGGHFGTQYKDYAWDALLGGTFTPSTEVSFALYYGDPGPAGGSATEVAGNNYSRPVYDNDNVTWAASTGGIKSNDIVIDFPTPTGGDWGTPTHFAVWDVDTGYVVGVGPISPLVTILDGQPVSFPVGSLALRFQDT